MEAQFAWDDKTIRQTFIRKVWLSGRRGTPVRSAAQSWPRVPPPAGLRHPLSAAAGHSRHSCSLFLLVKPERIHLWLPSLAETVIWLFFASTARRSGSTSRPTLACTWRHSEWKTNLKSNNFRSVKTFDVLMCSQLHVLYHLHRAVLLRRAEVNLLYSKSDAIMKSSLVGFLFFFFKAIFFLNHNFIQTGGNFHGISFCWSSL